MHWMDQTYDKLKKLFKVELQKNILEKRTSLRNVISKEGKAPLRPPSDFIPFISHGVIIWNYLAFSYHT